MNGKQLFTLEKNIFLPNISRHLQPAESQLCFPSVAKRHVLPFCFPLQEMTIAAACAPPGGGRNHVTPRFIRHFSMLCLPTPSEHSLKQIFKVRTLVYTHTVLRKRALKMISIEDTSHTRTRKGRSFSKMSVIIGRSVSRCVGTRLLWHIQLAADIIAEINPFDCIIGLNETVKCGKGCNIVHHRSRTEIC